MGKHRIMASSFVVLGIVASGCGGDDDDAAYGHRGGGRHHGIGSGHGRGSDDRGDFRWDGGGDGGADASAAPQEFMVMVDGPSTSSTARSSATSRTR